MKKVFLLLVAVVSMTVAANAQSALGVRFSGGYGYGAELSYLHGLGGNRLELDLGWSSGDNHNSLSLTGTYQWTGNIAGNFGWYAGPGAHLGFWTGHNYSDFNIALVGIAGIEYKFNAVPIQLSLDIRPRFNLIPHTDFAWGGIAFGARWCF